ncbi:hypothetical protein ACJJID_01775 [Microbulbifer sp. CnH-101-G]|uniref:hypothetical protein n=1 Tax=Microbulbifer sp. CnH-101-G TaxID=3243393 RepID=UPI00403A2006
MKFLKTLFPRPPSFLRARKIEKGLSECTLSFEAPPYSDPFSSVQEWETEPDLLDIFDSDNYHPIKYSSTGKVERDAEFPHLNLLGVFSSRWTFKELSVFERYGGHIGFGIEISAVDDLSVNESLFENSVLLQEVFRKYELMIFCEFNKGLKSDPVDLTQYRWPSYLGPLNSQWVEQGGLDWLYFETQPLVSGSDSISWHTAISDKYILSCHFTITRAASNAGNTFRINQRMPWDNYINFIQKIMDSLKLELSPELNARHTEVQSQPGANSKSVFGCSPQQIEDAKHVMQMWSGRGYTDSSRDKNESHRATPEEVSEFIDKRIQLRPLHNSYPLEEKIEVVSRLPPELIQRPLIGPR